MENEKIQIIYGIEIQTLGVKKAFKENIKEIEEISRVKQIIKEIEKIGGDTNFKIKAQKISSKLDYIIWTLMYKKTEKNKDVIPLLIQELKNIITELEEL